MIAYVLMRDGYLEGVFVTNESLTPVKRKSLGNKAEAAGMSLYAVSVDPISELETYIREETEKD